MAPVRRKVMKVLGVRRNISVEEGEECEDVGYLIFHGRKSLLQLNPKMRAIQNPETNPKGST